MFFHKKIAGIIAALYLLLTSAVYAQPLNNSQADSVRRLEEALGGGSAAGASQNTSAAVQAARGGTAPRWVNNPYLDYPQNRYIAAVGAAANRANAEKQAFAALAAFFGQSVKSDIAVSAAYSQAVRNGIVSVSEKTEVRETIVTAAALDNLIGAAIGGVWEDGRGTVYALAYIEKERAVLIYTELIRINQRNIESLVSVNAAGKNTFDGYARYRLASLLAGMNAQYSSIVSLAGGSKAALASLNLADAASLSLEADGIIKNIPVGFSVRNDRNSRVRDAFAKVLSGEGLRTQGSGSPYVLEIDIDMEEVKLNSNFFSCRYTVSANLTDRAAGVVLIPFNISGRANHSASYSEAQNRAFIEIEREISGKYPAAFREGLAALLPR